MNKNTFTTVKLSKGEMHVYDFGTVKLHAYKTNDFIDNEVFILEKNGRAVIIESPCFFDNIKELEQYLENIQVEGMLIAYHGAGAAFMPEVPKYATQNAAEYSLKGGGKALIDNFTNTFGESFDGSVHNITDIIQEGRTKIGGIEFIIKQTEEAFDIVIPQINAVYTHMLGHDCHSIVAGAAHADGIIAQLKDYIQKGYDLILTSHYTPEDLKDAQAKIDYLENLKKIASDCADANSFKAEVQKRYPAYGGQNYLDMTAGFFFR
ncbi:MAG: hypothetical protein DBY09_03790 [Selenomonadales bacterium]|jgi:hypothetical protein|nr:hypothetical protein [Clostridiales bacterium]PWL99947.1 MAG: hypothetical protein DBY09_03790 [Selenomonadales bacterium]